MMGWKFIATSILILFITFSESTELAPWFGKILEVESRSSPLIQHYHSLDTKFGTRHRTATDVFFDLSLSLAPAEEKSLELEIITAATEHRSYGLDSFLITGRYRLLNDIVGDPLSLVAGLTISKIFKPARHDIAIFHHGGIGSEVHLSLGKELSCLQFWTTRFWGVCGIGIADEGYPWIRAQLDWEHNWWDNHQLRFFVHSLWGLGRSALNPYHFKGYGPIRHQSVDGGLRYSHILKNQAVMSLEYSYRLFGKNCPIKTERFFLEFFYPFKL